MIDVFMTGFDVITLLVFLWTLYQEWRLRKITKDILNDERPVQGPRFWKYKGELLTERRKRLEES